MMKSMLSATRSWFPYLQLFGEFAVGVGLTLGFLTPLSALVGIFMNLNFVAMAGVRPRKDPSVNPCFRVEQGQNLAMILAQMLIIMAGSWRVWSLDGLLEIF
jgi:thiosulfate dehydrogenase [quinone] large subunit